MTIDSNYPHVLFTLAGEDIGLRVLDIHNMDYDKSYTGDESDNWKMFMRIPNEHFTHGEIWWYFLK